MKHSRDETNRLTDANTQFRPGVYDTPKGFLIKSSSAQVFLPIEQAKAMVDDLEDMVIILRAEIERE